jgi:methionyl-tRNA synthetase
MAQDQLIPLLILAAIVWSVIWKGIALWKSGRNNQPAWFIALLVINTGGILEIIYISFFQRNKN